MAPPMLSSQSPAAALVAMLVLSFQDVPSLPKPTPVPRGVRLPIARLTPDAVIAIPGAPADIAVDAGVAVATRETNEIAWIAPKTNAVSERTPIGASPCAGLAFGFGGAWVPACATPQLVRIDSATRKVVATIATPVLDGTASIVTGVGSVWVLADATGRLLRLDPDTNKPVAELSVPAGASALAFGEGALWVTIARTNQVVRIDAHTNVVEKVIRVGKAPSALAVGEGAVWTLNRGDGTVSRIDPKTNAPVAAIESGVTAADARIAAGEGAVWVTAAGSPLVRIDPASNAVTQQFEGEGGGGLAVGHGSVWLANTKAGTVWRLDPKLVASLVP